MPRPLSGPGSIPALGVAVIQSSMSFRNDAEQQSGRIAHHPPGVRLLYQFGAESLQPGHFRGWVVGVDIDVHPALALVEALDQQPQVLTMQRSAARLALTAGVDIEMGVQVPS